MERVHNKVACGFAGLEARIDAQLYAFRSGHCCSRKSVMDRVMLKFNEEYKRKMNDEDKHTINNYKYSHTLVRKLELDIVALKERKEEQCCEYRPQRRQQGVVIVEGTTQGCRWKPGTGEGRRLGLQRDRH